MRYKGLLSLVCFSTISVGCVTKLMPQEMPIKHRLTVERILEQYDSIKQYDKFKDRVLGREKLGNYW